SFGIGGNNAFFGYQSGFSNTTGYFNAFFGSQAGQANTFGIANAFFGNRAGHNNISGYFNTFIGEDADFYDDNTTGSNNTLLGSSTHVSSGVDNGTAIGASASVTQSNALVLGSNNVSVGIGTTAPTNKLQIVDSGNTGLRVQTNTAGGTVASFGGNGA